MRFILHCGCRFEKSCEYEYSRMHISESYIINAIATYIDIVKISAYFKPFSVTELHEEILYIYMTIQ